MRFPAASRIISTLLVAVLAALCAGQGARAGTSILDYGDKGRLDQLHDVAPGEPGPNTKGNLKSLPQGAERAAKTPPLPAPEKVAPETWYEPGEVIVANPPKDFDIAAASEGFRVLEKFRLAALSFEVWRLRVPSGVTVPEAVARLRGRFPGLLLDANHRYKPSQGPDPAASQARAAIGWSGIDARCGLGVKIGMVDTPVDISHPALAGQKVTYRSFIRPQRTPAPADHGTAIAAMLVGKPDRQGLGGLLPGAELLAANIFTFNDAGSEAADVVAMLKALDWLAGERVHAVNLSMAGTDNRILHYAVSQAAAKAMILIAAVGNWGTADKPAYPAAYPESIGTTAVDANGNIYQYANRGGYVAFAAPGVEIWTAVPGGGKFQSGTSFAAPYLTSVIATEAANGGTISADRFREMLAGEAEDLGPPGRDDTFGWGLVKRPPLCTRNEAAAPRRGSE
jgi:subtilisin family serine protease